MSGRARKFAIDADIQAKPVSRQRRLQLQWLRMGRCQTCGSEALDGRVYCLRHAIAARERQRIKVGSVRRNTGSRSYRMEAAQL